MLEWFTDDAFFPASIGIFLSVVLIAMAVFAANKPLFRIGAVIGLLTVALIVTEVLIVSDRESAANAVYDMAEAMNVNDIDKVLGYLDNDELVTRAKGHLRGAECHACRVTAMNGIEVTDSGKKATVDFVAFAQASNREFPQPVPIQQAIKLHMKKVGDGWKIYDFEVSDPQRNLKL